MSRLGRRTFVAVLALGLLVSAVASARTLYVRAGGSIRTALAQAHAGDTIKVFPGVYREGQAGDPNALAISLDGIQLVGMSRPGRPVVLQNAGGQSFGIWVSPSDSIGATEADAEHPPCAVRRTRVAGFSLQGFTVRGFAVHGVHLACVDDFALLGNVADSNTVYGLFPILSSHGVVAFNEILRTGSDAAVYVGQSDDVLVYRNHVHDSLLGIELQNCTHSSVIANNVHGNTLGILVDIAPDTIFEMQENTRVALNRVHDNARPNTAEAGDIIGVLPPGIGILLVGGSAGTVTANDVERNKFAGIAVTSLCLGLQLLGQPCTGLDIDPTPHDNRVTLNTVLGNGTVPSGNPALDPLRADLVWDGSGSGNCWSGNTAATAVPPGLPRCE